MTKMTKTISIYTLKLHLLLNKSLEKWTLGDWDTLFVDLVH